MKRFSFALAIVALCCLTANAQRKTDALDRGLVAIPDGNTEGSTSNMVTWRRLADEYFGVTYNLYKDGSLLAEGLTTTCYSDSKNALASTQYQVAAVVNGIEQSQSLSSVVTPWTQYVYKLNIRCVTGYIDLNLSTITDGSGNDITSHYLPNDAEFADLDGDGQLEMIIKRLNTVDSGSNFAYDTQEHDRIDAYDINWQTGQTTLLWWIDVGPNMVSGGSHELNIIAYDWDGDGKAEVVLRGADDMMVCWARGGSRTPYPQRIGTKGVNTRNSVTHTANMTYTNTGAEYLIYMNGDTGQPYWVIDYPLARGNANDWGDSYGHRSSKYFFGAPVLDGRKASLFLARGIYTRHKMIAYDINPSTHELTQRWYWENNGGQSDPWYGNGNHNYCIADVDEDGRDEIVYGSMVIDDNGKGLSTTGLGHGDALHCSDFDPYRKGLEIFACNEDEPCMNYRNATTSQFYVRRTSSSDDGRALCANFSNAYPGATGRSTQTGMISCVADKDIPDYAGDNFIAWSDLNFRIYWDGDLCSEILNSPGTEKEAKVEKPGTGRLFTSSDTNMNNWTKNHPCFQGDLIGDWREEIVLRHGTGVRIYTSGMFTGYSMPSLWLDHEYRQAMVWQMHAYNQPPHLSYFLGELEGFDVAPPPYTMQNRTEIGNGGTINSLHNGKQLIMAATGNISVSVNNGAAPALLVDNAPTWVQGNNGGTIATTTYTHTLTGGAFTGGMHLVKQGDGILKMSNTNHTYTGRTEIWAGRLEFDGTLASSPVWMNRFTTLKSEGGQFLGGIESLYASTIIPGGDNKRGDITTTTLTLNYGARLKIDVFGNSIQADHVNMESLVLNTKSGGNWETFGPQYLKPVIEFVPQGSLADGMYLLGQLTNEADFSNVIIEGLNDYTYSIVQREGNWYLKIGTVECTEPVIARTSWNETDLNVYYPTVSITADPFTFKGNTVTPTLSAVFTALNGNTHELDGMIYSNNYENVSEISGWTSLSTGYISLGEDDDHSKCFKFTNSGSTRYAYTVINDADVSSCERYIIQFDLALTPTSNYEEQIEFCVMSKGGSLPGNWTGWDHYSVKNNQSNYLFEIVNEQAKSSTTYTLNNGTETTSISSGVWYTYTLEVDRTNNTVTYYISNGKSGVFTLPDGTSNEFNGFYFVSPRNNSIIKLDNIIVREATSLTSYTFTEPGTLTVTASYDGCIPKSTSYTSEIGAKVGSLGYSTFNFQLASLDFSKSGIELYKVKADNDLKSVTTTKVNDGILPQGTAALLKGTAGEIYASDIVSSASEWSDNDLIPTTGTVYGNGSIYVLNTGSSGVGFYRLLDDGTVTVGRGYLNLQGSSVKVLPFEDDDTPTGIIAIDAADIAKTVIYDLSGRRVSKPSRGIYIVNGKKVLIK